MVSLSDFSLLHPKHNRWLQPRAPDIKRAAVPSRMALVDLERALAHALEIEEAEARAGAGV